MAALVQIMAWHRTGDKPLFDPMMIILLMHIYVSRSLNELTPMALNSSPPRQFGGKIADDIFKCIFVNENDWISIKISLKFIPKSPIDNKSVLDQVMAWRRQAPSHYLNQCWPSFLTHICGTRGRWVKSWWPAKTMQHHRTWSTLSHKMAYRLFNTKALSGPMAIYSQLDLSSGTYFHHFNQNTDISKQ